MTKTEYDYECECMKKNSYSTCYVCNNNRMILTDKGKELLDFLSRWFNLHPNTLENIRYDLRDLRYHQ